MDGGFVLLLIIFGVISYVSNVSKKRKQQEEARRKAQQANMQGAPSQPRSTAPASRSTGAPPQHDPRFPDYVPQKPQNAPPKDPRFPDYAPAQGTTGSTSTEGMSYPGDLEGTAGAEGSYWRGSLDGAGQSMESAPTASQQDELAERRAKQELLQRAEELLRRREQLKQQQRNRQQPARPTKRQEGQPIRHTVSESVSTTMTPNVQNTHKHAHVENSMGTMAEGPCPPGDIEFTHGDPYEQAVRVVTSLKAKAKRDMLVEGIILSEILGKPKALQKRRSL